ncbi:patatin-like phospholipase RssA [Inmirania thermothiophila]|uniref:NTE family protein n=1 Tax=Inmirania thermothiophila TaxID=1750597 RepID=A0A3N1Y0E9_9GAMM|nr:patatin-like phospholipase RssA [Inmirania thermothiophila]ROR32309.1 NTE family protein [Inmirania thermothiophila]
MRRRPRIGVALGGGAARGWSHIGVLEALAERGIVPDVVAGTSIGALVGGAFAAGQLERLHRWVETLRWQDVVGYLDPAFNGGLIGGRRLFEFFRRHFEDRPIEALERPFGATATDIESGREVWLREGSLLEAVRASIALPGLFTPLARDGRLLVDGGLVDPVPVSLCRALGADLVIAVDLNADLMRRPPQRPAAEGDDEEEGETGRLRALLRLGAEELRRRLQREDGPSLIDVVLRSIHIMQYRITRSRMAGDPPDLLLAPRVGGIALMEFHRAAEAVAAGREAVDRAGAAIADLLRP